MNKYILPNWDAPKHIHARTTTKHIELDQLQADLNLAHPPIWLKQVHGADTHFVYEPQIDSMPIADASITTRPNLACVIRTADCLPILLTNQEGSFVAALHCGWQGLYKSLIQETIALAPTSSDIIAWIGPGISQANYEVDAAFFKRFCEKDAAYFSAFKPTEDKYLADLAQIAQHQLEAASINAVYQSKHCSFADAENCHSFRREGENAGRMATLIWIQDL